MKTILFISIFCLSNAFAKETYFTTVFYDDFGKGYVGVRQTDENENNYTSLNKIVSFEYPNIDEFTPILLPKDAEARPVVGVVPDREKLFVITHEDDVKTDGPMVHFYNTKKKKWKNLGKTQCPSFTKVKLDTTKLVFFCEEATKHGIRVVPKPIRLGSERLFRSGFMRFPEFLLRYKGTTFVLEGKAPHWDKLRIKTTREVGKVYRAEELFDIAAKE